MSFEAILMHQNYQQGEQADFEEFRQLLLEVNKEETLRDHDFRVTTTMQSGVGDKRNSSRNDLKISE